MSVFQEVKDVMFAIGLLTFTKKINKNILNLFGNIAHGMD